MSATASAGVETRDMAQFLMEGRVRTAHTPAFEPTSDYCACSSVSPADVGQGVSSKGYVALRLALCFPQPESHSGSSCNGAPSIRRGSRQNMQYHPTPCPRLDLGRAFHCCAVAEWTLRSSAAWQNQAP